METRVKAKELFKSHQCLNGISKVFLEILETKCTTLKFDEIMSILEQCLIECIQNRKPISSSLLSLIWTYNNECRGGECKKSKLWLCIQTELNKVLSFETVSQNPIIGYGLNIIYLKVQFRKKTKLKRQMYTYIYIN